MALDQTAETAFIENTTFDAKNVNLNSSFNLTAKRELINKSLKNSQDFKVKIVTPQI